MQIDELQFPILLYRNYNQALVQHNLTEVDTHNLKEDGSRFEMYPIIDRLGVKGVVKGSFHHDEQEQSIYLQYDIVFEDGDKINLTNTFLGYKRDLIEEEPSNLF